MMGLRYEIATVFLLLIIGIKSIVGRSDTVVRKELRQFLLKDYDKYMRPVQHHHNVTTVSMSFVPWYLLGLDEEKQIISLSGWLILEWKDEHLQWKPEEYGGKVRLTMADHDVWQPDIVVYESIPSSEIDPQQNTHVTVGFDGTVTWSPPVTINSQCSLDFQNYPQDTQYCNITFGSWNHDGSAVDLQIKPFRNITRRFINKNLKWNLLDINFTRTVVDYQCCEEPFVIIVYTLSLQRRSGFSEEIVWVAILIAMLTTLVTFWLPPESGQKITVGCMMMLVLTGLLMFLAWMVKSTIALSILVLLIQRCLIIIFTVLLTETFIINLSSASFRLGPPSSVNDILSGTIGVLLCIPADNQRTGPLTELNVLNSDDSDYEHKQYSVKRSWRRVSIAIDRIAFLIYIFVIGITLSIS